MSHVDAKPSWHHTPRQDHLYLDDTPPDSTSTDPDKSPLLGKGPLEHSGTEAPYAVLPNEPDADDAELIRLLKSESGRDLVHNLCQTEKLKNLLIDFMHEAKNPELRNVLRDSIVTNSGIRFDSTLEHLSHTTSSSAATPIAELLTTRPDSAKFLSHFFIRMHSNELVQYLLLESERTSSPPFDSFLSDTLVGMDHDLVVPEILEHQNKVNANQKLLNTILQRISQEPSCRKMISDWDEQLHNGRLSVEAEEPRQTRYQGRAFKEPRLTSGDKIEQVDSPSDDHDDSDSHNESSENASFWHKVEVQFDRVVDAVTDIFESSWVKKVFRVGWIKESFNRALIYLEQKSFDDDTPNPVDHLRDMYNKLTHEIKSQPSLQITLPDQKTPSPPSLVSFLEDTNDPNIWRRLQQFFVSFPDQENVRKLLIEMQYASPEMQERFKQLIIEMDPKVTIPVIIESQFQSAHSNFSHQDWLTAIQDAHSNDQQLPENAPDDVAVLRRQRTLEIPRAKTSPTLIEDPPGPLQFLDSDYEEFRIVYSIYLGDQNDPSKHLTLLLRDLANRLEKGTLSGKNIANTIHLFKEIGPERVVPILLDEHNHQGTGKIRTLFLAELARSKTA